jgi:hypothetical protein
MGATLVELWAETEDAINAKAPAERPALPSKKVRRDESEPIKLSSLILFAADVGEDLISRPGAPGLAPGFWKLVLN